MTLVILRVQELPHHMDVVLVGRKRRDFIEDFMNMLCGMLAIESRLARQVVAWSSQS